MSVSSGGSILALASGAGWKAREPALQYYLLGSQLDNALEGVSLNPGLTGVPRFVTTDEDLNLAFLADDAKIKSFSFGLGEDGKVPKRLPNIHTLHSEGVFDGPIAALLNGRIARAGKGRAAIWNTSVPEGDQESTGTLAADATLDNDNWREARHPSDEISLESQPHSIVAFADDPTYAPATWHLHAPSRRLLCGERAARSGGYSCVSLDLEHGGRQAARYLGHGGDVVRITASPDDPNLFVTAASDGYARMFD
ncbi:hypothetical protein TRAPUB_14178, partial [Trametes pubescens]